jgi:hypothetical protein
MPKGIPKSKINTLVNDEQPEKTPKAKAKAKSKGKANNNTVVAVVSADGEIQGTFTPEPRRPLIAHLPFRSTEIQFQDGPLVYDPRPPGNPQPYDAGADNLYSSNAEVVFSEPAEVESMKLPVTISESDIVQQEPAVDVKLVKEESKAFKTIDILVEYSVSNETMTIPESTHAACFWCSGTFEGRPIVLPSLEQDGVYSIYGNFCTLSCSMSYLLNEHIDPQVRWERQALLHRMYKQIEVIHPAPPKESLTYFGGTLSHAEYRDIIQSKNIRIDLHLPPVISILASLDTKPIDFYETSLRNTSARGAGMDIQRPQESGLRLKRTKPLKDKNSTLDAVMNLQVNRVKK